MFMAVQPRNTTTAGHKCTRVEIWTHVEMKVQISLEVYLHNTCCRGKHERHFL